MGYLEEPDSTLASPAVGEIRAQTSSQEASHLGDQQPAASDHDAEPAAVVGSLPLPDGTQPIRIYWTYAISLFVIHAMALLVLVPYFFSWSGVAVGLISYVVLNMLGVTIGYHRLLTHRGFTCPKWMEHGLALCGVCTLQDSPARWVAVHRMHHQHSDEQDDPHTPRAGFWWSHVGWLLVRNRKHDHPARFERYARDLFRDPFYMKLEKRLWWVRIYLIHAAVIMAMGFAVGWVGTGTLAGALQLMYSWMVWGIVLRTVVTLHITWAVNSVTHVWGYRNYETGDNSRNNWWVALFAFGEGWHNNHHAYQRAARHGHRRWEIDFSWMMIRCWEIMGLVDNVVRPPHRLSPSVASNSPR